eukprot:scaffold929_cov387-Prasinococcus_capsulatus_cf.AAC.2
MKPVPAWPAPTTTTSYSSSTCVLPAAKSNCARGSMLLARACTEFPAGRAARQVLLTAGAWTAAGARRRARAPHCLPSLGRCC